MKTVILVIFALFTGYVGITQKTKLNICVDERVELITALQLICNAGVPTLTGADIYYKKEVKEYLDKYKDHPAVKFIDSTYWDYFNFAMPFQLILHYSLPNFKVITPFASLDFDFGKEYVKHKDSLSLFIQQLKDFYIRSNFHAFFKEHKKYYDSLCNDVTKIFENKNIIKVFEKHYGIVFASYNLILSPLSHSGGFGFKIRNENKATVFAIIGPDYKSKNYPEFTENKTSIIHELSHSFSNPVIDSCWSFLKEDTCLYRLVIKDMQKQFYGNWKTVVIETLNRANQVLLTKQLFGEAEGKKIYDDFISRKFIYIPLCMEVLEKYKSNRNIYHIITDIKPLLYEAFEAEKIKFCQ